MRRSRVSVSWVGLTLFSMLLASCQSEPQSEAPAEPLTMPGSDLPPGEMVGPFTVTKVGGIDDGKKVGEALCYR